MPKRLLLSIENLHVRVGNPEAVRGVDFRLSAGEFHALMGPNGAGKTSLLHALAGHPACTVTQGRVRFRGKDLLALQAHERAQAGLFLAFQHPREIAGVTVRNFLYAALLAREGSIAPLQFEDDLARGLESLGLPAAFADRPLRSSLSGGERKKLELLQILILKPVLVLFDEIDAGLDLDALRDLVRLLKQLRKSSSFSALFVSHSPRLLALLTPDRVHVMIGGRIVAEGSNDLVRKLEQEGFKGI